LKNNFEVLDKESILDKIVNLDIERWHYIKDNSNATHIGPIAQDFYEAFKVGDDTTISTIDPAGIALLGIQQLAANNQIKDAKIDALQKENDLHQKQIDDLTTIILQLKGEMEKLKK
jgi:hypothetical protein